MKGKKVLIIEDQLIYQNIFINILGKILPTTIAKEGEEAIQLLKREKFDLILLDLQLSKMDGKKVFLHIQKEKLSSAPILAISPSSSSSDQAILIELGFKGFISKPINAKELLKCISIHLDLKKPNSEEELLFKIIDPNVFRQLRKFNSPSMMLEVYLKFIAESDEILFRLKKMSPTLKREEIIDHLHVIKGNSGTLGIREVYSEASRLESIMRNKTKKSLDFNILKLETEIDVLKEFIINKAKIFEYEFS